MSRFNKPGVRTVVPSLIRSEQAPSTITYEGGPGYLRDAKSQLYLLAVVNLGDKAFYESAAKRNSRFVNLVREVTLADPEWITGFLSWVRRDGMMRTAPLIAAAEAVKVLVDAGRPGGRQVIANTLARADEPGEFLAYWTSHFGRKLPWPVKRGLGDACIKLYDEYRLMKYDTPSHGYRFADVLALTHPGERRNNQSLRPWQGGLFAHAIGRRYGRDDVDTELLAKIAANRDVRRVAVEDPSVLTDPDLIRRAGLTWEDVMSLAGNRVPKAALWEAVIPSMGYEALLKNLRNFEQAGMNDAATLAVTNALMDPERVARSGQFPMRFLVAYRNSGLRWAWPLEQALNLSLRNLPRLTGTTLVLVDRSESMFMGDALREDPRSGLPRAETAAIFGTALALAADNATLVQFGDRSQVVKYGPGASVLRTLDQFGHMGGTNTSEAIRSHYRGHDRVVIITDEQAARSGYGVPILQVPDRVPVYTWSLGGYAAGHGPSGPNRHTFGGLSDASFAMISLIEQGVEARWPWENKS